MVCDSYAPAEPCLPGTWGFNSASAKIVDACSWPLLRCEPHILIIVSRSFLAH